MTCSVISQNHFGCSAIRQFVRDQVPPPMWKPLVEPVAIFNPYTKEYEVWNVLPSACTHKTVMIFFLLAPQSKNYGQWLIVPLKLSKGSWHQTLRAVLPVWPVAILILVLAIALIVSMQLWQSNVPDAIVRRMCCIAISSLSFVLTGLLCIRPLWDGRIKFPSAARATKVDICFVLKKFSLVQSG